MSIDPKPRLPATADQFERDSITDFGFTDEEAAAFRTLCAGEYSWLGLHPVATQLLDNGESPEVALDYVRHGLDETDAGFFACYGFTGHQARLLARDPTVSVNLWEANDPDALLRDDTPRHWIVDVLRVAHTPAEAERFVSRYRSAAQQVTHREPETSVDSDTLKAALDDIELIEGEVALIAANLPAQRCTCA